MLTRGEWARGLMVLSGSELCARSIGILVTAPRSLGDESTIRHWRVYCYTRRSECIHRSRVLACGVVTMAQLNEAQYRAAMAELDRIWESRNPDDVSDPEITKRMLELTDLIVEYESEHFPIPKLSEDHPASDASEEEWAAWETANPFDPEEEYRP